MLQELPLKVTAPSRNAHDLHAAVCALMMEPRTDQERDFLYAAVPDPGDASSGGGIVVVRSARFPERLAAHAEPVDLPRDGQTRAFALDACPWRDRGRRGRAVVPPRQDASARIAWLVEAGRTHGFSVVSVSVEVGTLVASPPGRKPIILERCAFRGVLRVTDAAKLASGMALGIGRGRAFGLGMLRWDRS